MKDDPLEIFCACPNSKSIFEQKGHPIRCPAHQNEVAWAPSRSSYLLKERRKPCRAGCRMDQALIRRMLSKIDGTQTTFCIPLRRLNIHHTSSTILTSPSTKNARFLLHGASDAR